MGFLLSLCVGLALAPALASRVNRSPSRAVVTAGAAGLDLGRPSGQQVSRSAAAGVTTFPTFPPPPPDPPTTATPATPPTTRHVHPATTTTPVHAARPAATTTTHTHAPPTRPRPPTTTTTTTRPYANGQAGQASFYEAAAEGTCAHRTIPKGTTVKVMAVATGRSVLCRVADRGPYVDGRIVDLAVVDFERISGLHEGVIDVIIQW